MQVSLFEEVPEKQIENEEVLIASLKLGEFITTELIMINHIPHIKQQLKKSRWWPKGHCYEKDNEPSINELCEECLRTGFISELNDNKSCMQHGRAKRFREQDEVCKLDMVPEEDKYPYDPYYGDEDI